MRNLILTDAVIGPERDVILEERRSRIENSPDALLCEEVDATLYQNHPYRIPVIGWMHEMEKLNRTDAVAFYDRYYAPNNAILVVAGDVDADDGARAGRKDLRQGAARPGPAAAHPPDRAGAEHQAHRDADRSARQRAELLANPGWCRPITRAKPGEAEALDLLVGDSRRRRPQPHLPGAGGQDGHRLVGRRLLSTARSSTTSSFHRLRRAARRRPSSTRSRRRSTPRSPASSRTASPTRNWRSAKNRFVRSHDLRARQPVLAWPISTARRWRPAAPSRTSQEWPDRITAVTAEQVKAVAAKYLDADHSVTGYLLPVADQCRTRTPHEQHDQDRCQTRHRDRLDLVAARWLLPGCLPAMLPAAHAEVDDPGGEVRQAASPPGWSRIIPCRSSRSASPSRAAARRTRTARKAWPT